ncbi:hypothetical protein CRUP_009951 [Coryphaenoides rupestris]|nr:hypothetical protein CRUP_009951 [Coryphaenoides rupestris]
MLRSATKSRAETRGQRASVQQLAPLQSPEPPVEEVDVVPGRLTQTQWEDMLRSEATGDVVGEIMEELTGHVLEGCLRKHVHKQLVAFSVSWAKDFLVQALELEFLYRDEGDRPDEASSYGTEDLEPVPPPIDSWAQGCVPVVARPQNVEPESARPPCAAAQLISAPEQHEDRDRDTPADSSREYRCTSSANAP